MLPFLGISEIPKDEIEKARVLARCLQQQPCLLVLDGLEPLQYAENLQSMNGELQDSALKEFIACFRQTAGKSFVLFSSRQPLLELKKWQAEHYLSLDLQTLPHQDGADLLQALGVTGNAAERQAISQDLNGHALSLVLMGHLLVEHHQGDPRYAEELPPLTSAHGDSDAEKDSRHALRVLDYYDSLQDAASRCFLQLLGLFDRPMNAAEKAVLIANANHAEPLRALTAKQWQAVEQQLEKSGLLLGKKGTFERLEWDTHPIIRSFFAEKFKENYPEAFKQAHGVLFEYFQPGSKKRPIDPLMDDILIEMGLFFENQQFNTLDDMIVLYRAVLHGCLAGEYQEALNEVYRRYILRGSNYSLNELGAYSLDLIALSAFFPQGWSQPVSTGLTESEQAWLLSKASTCLMYLGRLAEAIEPREACTKLCVKLEAWDNAAVSTQLLIELLLSLGKLAQAETASQQAIEYVLRTNDGGLAHILRRRQNDEIQQTENYSNLATILHQRGELDQARQTFAQAEQLHHEDELNHPYLYGLVSSWYCALLLDLASNSKDLEHILKRGKYGLSVKTTKPLLDNAFNHFTLARTYQALQQPETARTEFDLAILGIQDAKLTLFTPLFYIYRANFYLTQNQLDPALADLNSAWEIIERCGMKLYAVDYLLIHGRYSLATANFDTALNHFQEAKQLIEETGYHLRDAELDLFAAQICHHTKQNLYAKTANEYLQKAKNRIDEIGQWGLMPRWEKVSVMGAAL